MRKCEPWYPIVARSCRSSPNKGQGIQTLHSFYRILYLQMFGGTSGDLECLKAKTGLQISYR